MKPRGKEPDETVHSFAQRRLGPEVTLLRQRWSQPSPLLNQLLYLGRSSSHYSVLGINHPLVIVGTPPNTNSLPSSFLPSRGNGNQSGWLIP